MNVLATPLARSNRDDFRPTGGAPATLQYSRDLGGSVEETPGVTPPETESLILLIATLESHRKASAFFF